MKFTKFPPFSALILSSLPAFAVEGTHTGGGGDTVAMEFTAFARGAIHLLQKKGCSQVSLPLAKLAVVINGTRVVSQDKTILEGFEVDAINYPMEKRIELSRSRWAATKDEPARVRLAVHEYLGILGMNDQRYQLSADLEKCLDVPAAKNSVIVDNQFADIVDRATLNPQDVKVGRISYPTSYVNIQSASASAGGGAGIIGIGGSSNITQTAPDAKPTELYQLSLTYKNEGRLLSVAMDCSSRAQCASVQKMVQAQLAEGKLLAVRHDGSVLHGVDVYGGKAGTSAAPKFLVEKLEQGTLISLKGHLVTAASYEDPNSQYRFCSVVARDGRGYQIPAGRVLSVKKVHFERPSDFHTINVVELEDSVLKEIRCHTNISDVAGMVHIFEDKISVCLPARQILYSN